MKNKDGMLKLDIKIVRKIFWNGSFGTYKAELRNADENIPNQTARTIETTIVGEFDKEYFSGEEYTMFGEQVIHPRYGHQYKIHFVKNKLESKDKMHAFLSNFCAPSICDQIFNKYGDQVVEKILSGDFDYSDVKGMGQVRYETLRKKVVENEYMSELIITLGDYGITANQMKRIIEKFGAKSIKKIKENPYNLCQVYGIGFLMADDIALKMGFDRESPFRIREAIKYVIEENQKSGDTWIELDTLTDRCLELLKIVVDIRDHVEKMSEIRVVDGRKVALETTYNAEKYVTDKLIRMLEESSELDIDVEGFLIEKEENDGYCLTKEQQQLFHNFAKYNINFLVGYAGCGKSYIQSLILDIADRLNLNCLLVAPTGKSAKVVSEYTGRNASTIHRALGIQEGNNSSREITEDIVIVDESSMCDIPLIAKLVQSAMCGHTRILFVGDDFQLPSVGVGLFLGDCVNSEIFPVTKLTKVFRQEEGGTLDFATKIRYKECSIPYAQKGTTVYGTDMIFHGVEQHEIESEYKDSLTRLRQEFSDEEIIVLTPTKKGNLGTGMINSVMQEIMNPPSQMKGEVKHGFSTFREGDRVINIRNNYNAINTDEAVVSVFNGDMGNVVKIDKGDEVVIIDYGFDKVVTPFSSLDTIVHAYALTIHKSQGSGFPAVILIADKAHKWQMNANLLYTGTTRTKKEFHLIGQADVVVHAIRKNESVRRNTFLKDMLIERKEVL